MRQLSCRQKCYFNQNLNTLCINLFIFFYLSLNFADYIFQCPWQEASVKVQKTFMIMIMRSQKPLVVTIGPFGAMTTNTALMIMKAAYSYATVMVKGYQAD
ncbi:uncharacterized protein LOC115885289 [Sitophilus oryzae]|uniref:Uncharacterized protein LOC115885289 n=1 Tax=Sitophilus oryzae TaxID=7048 RepID=A0A6J2Y849_SITOR|nr:uncharacterized protein LOC115885289 [Sitophilus oryzae]